MHFYLTVEIPGPRTPGMATSKPVVRHSEMDAGTSAWFDWLKHGNEVDRDCVSSNCLGFNLILIYTQIQYIFNLTNDNDTLLLLLLLLLLYAFYVFCICSQSLPSPFHCGHANKIHVYSITPYCNPEIS